MTRDVLLELTESLPEFQLHPAPSRSGRDYVQQPSTLRDLACGLADFGDHVALDDDLQSITYGEFWEQVVGFAHWLVDNSVDLGDRVSLVGANHIVTPAAFWACQAVGAVFVPLNPIWTTDELDFALRDADPKFVLVDAVVRPKLPARWRARAILMDRSDEPGMREWRQVSEGGRHTGLPDRQVAPSDLATIVYTSGTTGRPKGVVHTHHNHAVAFRNASLGGVAAARVAAPSSAGEPESAAQPVVLHALPWFHVAGLGAMCTGLLNGARNVVLRRWNAAEAVRLIKERSVTIFGGVPTMLAQVLGLVVDGVGDELHSLTTVTSGASTVPPQLIRALAERVGPGAGFQIGYGLTETTAAVVVTLGSDVFSRPDSIGYPFPVNDVRLVDPSLQEVAPGEVGEIWVSGPTVAQGYWRDEDATSRAFVSGGFRTGDLARRDDDGYLYIVGRIKDVIIRGGENIQAAEIETVIAALPEVMSVAVVGVSHPTLGEEVVAVVNTYPHTDVTDERLEELCRARLAPYKVPARFVRTLDIPRNATGKALKDSLRKLLESQN